MPCVLMVSEVASFYFMTGFFQYYGIATVLPAVLQCAETLFPK